MEGIQISVNQAASHPDISVVSIQGYIDTTTASELERVLQNLLREQRYRIVIDLTQVEYISSAGWGIFISEIKNIRSRHGDLKLAKMSSSVSEVYELLEFSTILQSAETVDAAVAMFEAASPAPGASGPAPAAKPAAAPPARGPVTSPGAAAPKPAAPPSAARPVEPKPAPARIEPVTPAPAAPRIEPAARPKSAPPPPVAKPVSAPPAAVAAARPPAPSPAVPAGPPAAPPASAPLPAEDFAEETPAVPENQDAILVPLNQRIRAVVRAHPDWGALKIKGELNRRRGSQPKVSWGEVRAELKFSGLKTKADRFRFAQGR